ncbi:TPA: GNAT family N-acetyltransferase [Yersinia enterocolitica]
MKSKIIINIIVLLLLTTSPIVTIAREMDSDCTTHRIIPQINKEYLSPTNNQAVCLYNDDDLSGNSMCFTPGENIDFIDRDDEVIENDSISSISIPDGMFATIYKNDNYNPPYLNLMESIGQRDLAFLGMDDQISSVKVDYSPIEDCSKNCVIMKRMQLLLSDIFAKNWDDSNYPNKQVLLSFDINDQSDFMVELTLGPIVWYTKKSVAIFNSHNNEPLEFGIQPETDRFSLLFHLHSNRIAVDYMESRGTEQISLSPTIIVASAPFDRPVETAGILINNTGEYPLVIDQIVMAASAEYNTQSVHHKSERDTAGTLGCAFIPALAIYNYITHSRCNQGDILWSDVTHWFSDENKVISFTGNAPLLKPQPELPVHKNNQAAPLTLTLNKINTQLHHQALTLPATAQFCRTPIDNILATRYPRSPGDNCPQWISRVLADFTTLFGHSVRDWTPEQLQEVITRIDAQQATGYAGSDQATEEHLVNEVRGAIQHQGWAETLQQITRAFEYARLNYATYLTHNPSASAPPAAAQNLPLGMYSVSLASYQYPAELPPVRIRENNEWVARPDLHFEVEILNEPDAQAVAGVLTTVRAWSQTDFAQYSQLIPHDDELMRHAQLGTIFAIQATSSILLSALEEPEDHLFVVVRLGGEIIHVLSAVSHSFNDEIYNIHAAITAPNNILNLTAEGSIRGAGTVAGHELARYLKEKKVRTIRADVISQSAAKVSIRFGFKHDEL